jgi:DNA polymerase alpha subunit A
VRKHTKNFDGSEIKNKKNSINGEEDDFDCEDADLPIGASSTKDAILPNVLRNLVVKRRGVK